ncbi:MAG: cation diffusion facilitator family transporter [Candidatus Marinimicrobia bacterium]|nr:cation diffusion facilitator family transporter [Candidatus Neomarinimicrobiota bacterium]
MAHEHNHDQIGKNTSVRMFITMTMNFIITGAEIVGGILSGSLALISDALHNLTDGIAIIISYIALKLKRASHSPRHTFGLKRAEIFAATINSTVLFGISLFLFYKAIQRLINPQPIEGKLMIIIASIGLVANVIGTFLLHRDSHKSMNIKSAYLHLLIDAMSSLVVIIGGILIAIFDIVWIDPVLTILIGAYVLQESIKILRESSHILMEGAPSDIDLRDIKKVVEKIPEVKNIHHIHIWNVGEKDVHFEAHIDVTDMLVSETCDIQNEIVETLKKKFPINHITLQFECDTCDSDKLIHNPGKDGGK